MFQMRKITLNPRIGNHSTVDFNNNWIVVKSEDQIHEFSAPRREDDYRGFTEEQRKVIRTVNYVLEHNKQPLMDNEEIEHLLYPFGKEVTPTTEELQALAGFRVEKTISKIGE